MNIWKKNCPNCGKEQIYSCKSILTLSIKENRVCNPCRANESKTRPPMDKWKRVCPKCNDDIIYKSVKGYFLGNKINSICHKCAGRESAKYADKSFFKTNEYRNKMSDSLKRVRNTDKYGDSFKEKCRINRANQLENGITGKINYNPLACKFIDTVNQKFGWKLQHAINGGEKMIEGFFVDGYDKEKNIIFEYDEPKHHTLSQEKRDKVKEKVIIKSINPSKFIRYSEKYNNMYDIVNKEFICQHQ